MNEDTKKIININMTYTKKNECICEICGEPIPRGFEVGCDNEGGEVCLKCCKDCPWFCECFGVKSKGKVEQDRQELIAQLNYYTQMCNIMSIVSFKFEVNKMLNKTENCGVPFVSRDDEIRLRNDMSKFFNKIEEIEKQLGWEVE